MFSLQLTVDTRDHCRDKLAVFQEFRNFFKNSAMFSRSQPFATCKVIKLIKKKRNKRKSAIFSRSSIFPVIIMFPSKVEQYELFEAYIRTMHNTFKQFTLIRCANYENYDKNTLENYVITFEDNIFEYSRSNIC